MKIFVTGATGYIGGSVAAALVAEGHEVHGLARSAARAAELEARNIEPVIGTLEDRACLETAVARADAVVNAANADHRDGAERMLHALAGSNKTFLHTSGSSIVGTRAGGEATDQVFTETTPFEPSSARAARVALNRDVLAATASDIRSVIVCPSLIYGRGLGLEPDSMQVPWLIALARKHGAAKHIGPGTNIWSNVHIEDLVDLYVLALDQAPAGAFYFAENGENSMREMCQAISRMLGFGGGAEAMTMAAAETEWGEGPTNDTMASNSRVRALRAREELSWAPQARSLIEEIEQGCYTEEAGR
jgi:nucleoside-diphosphate-sugar epimerase